MTAPDFAIETIDLCKTYHAAGNMPEKLALDNINLKVPRGSIFGLLGPNGAGKSTFINILAGLVTKSSGKVNIWGLDIDTNPRSSRSAIGVVNQEIAMDPFFTPLQALNFQAGYYGVPKEQRRILEILQAVGLDDKKDAYVRQLSGGMKRRLMVAKALVHNPPVLILDEPTAGVDVELRRSLWSYVRELNEMGTTIILTTHYLEEAEELCNEIAIINDGRVLTQEPKQQLLGRLDKRVLSITPREPVTQIPDSLAGLDASISADGTILIKFRTAETGIGRLLEQVREAGIGISDLATSQPSLEDVFVAMTSRAA
ncbi:MAG: ABC transporter ATP-binding protein [Henriciella sp.]